MPDYSKRREKLQKLVRKGKCDALLVTNFTNVTYLTGFTGDDSYLLVGCDHVVLISDMRYETQLGNECPGLDLIIRAPGQEMLPTAVDAVKASKAKRMGVEADSMTVGLRDKLAEKLTGVDLAPLDGLVEELRVVKDKHEIDATRVACEQARRAFEVVKAGLTPQMTELDIAAELEYQARRFGAKGLSFPPIIAVGPQAALPHASPGKKRVEEADFTLFDWGANEGLYISDLTRMVVTGSVSARFEKLYNLVLKAQLAGIEAIKPGAKCKDVDAAARKVIEKAGYGKQFGHGLGHGTGLEVHEAPRLAKTWDLELKPGMIVTVEPGVYFPGWGGIRIEDDVL
ncbi:MAG: aminopeptidase P family protein, partial [Planctomycetales bacterium]|nr:aminopeptidase P family protein [Planctomycetales bacterium]